MGIKAGDDSKAERKKKESEGNVQTFKNNFLKKERRKKKKNRTQEQTEAIKFLSKMLYNAT